MPFRSANPAITRAAIESAQAHPSSEFTLETALFLGLAAIVGRARSWFARRRMRIGLEAATGTLLIGLGARVALTER